MLLSITLNVEPTSDLAEVARLACSLARQHDTHVSFKYGDYPIWVDPEDSPSQVVASYLKAFERNANAERKHLRFTDSKPIKSADAFIRRNTYDPSRSLD